MLRTLESLGFEWEGEMVYQSRRFDAYKAAQTLIEKGMPIRAAAPGPKSPLSLRPPMMPKVWYIRDCAGMGSPRRNRSGRSG